MYHYQSSSNEKQDNENIFRIKKIIIQKVSYGILYYFIHIEMKYNKNESHQNLVTPGIILYRVYHFVIDKLINNVLICYINFVGAFILLPGLVV